MLAPPQPGMGFAATCLAPGSLDHPGQTVSLGAPRMAKILESCSSSPAPWKRTCFLSSSPMMQPRDHMSTAVLYILVSAHQEATSGLPLRG